eukprot:755150-Hanusia_phi.AAC.3
MQSYPASPLVAVIVIDVDGNGMDGSPNDVRQLFTQVGHESDFLLLFPHDLIALHNDGDEHVEEETDGEDGPQGKVNPACDPVVSATWIRT